MGPYTKNGMSSYKTAYADMHIYIYSPVSWWGKLTSHELTNY